MLYILESIRKPYNDLCWCLSFFIQKAGFVNDPKLVPNVPSEGHSEKRRRDLSSMLDVRRFLICCLFQTRCPK